MLATNGYQMQIELLPELLSLIPDILGAEYLTQLDNFGSTIIEYRALANAALVCKDWHFKASRYLNGFLKLASFSDVLDALQDVPKQAHIHTVSICPSSGWRSDEPLAEESMKRLLDALPNIHRLEIRGPPGEMIYWPSVSQFPGGGEHIKELLSSGRLSHLTLGPCYTSSQVFTSLSPSIESLAIEEVQLLDTIELGCLSLPAQLHALKLENYSQLARSITAQHLLHPYTNGGSPSWFSTLQILVLSTYASGPREGRLAICKLLSGPKLRRVGFTRSREMSLFFLVPTDVKDNCKVLDPQALTMDTLHRIETISLEMWPRYARDLFLPLAQFLETKNKLSNLEELRLDFRATFSEKSSDILSMRDIYEADWKPLDVILCKEAYGSLKRLVIDVSREPSRKRRWMGNLVPHEWFQREALPGLASRGVTIAAIGDFDIGPPRLLLDHRVVMHGLTPC